MVGIKCRGCEHDQNDHREKRMSPPGERNPIFAYECLYEHCGCALDGASEDSGIRKPGGKRLVLPTRIEKEIAAQQERQAAVGVQGESPEKFVTTSPDELLNRPVHGQPWKDAEP